MQPLEGHRAVLCPDLPLSVISALNLDFNLGLTCCYICIQLIFQGCGGGVMLLWQPNNSGPEDRRNGISGSRPPKDLETPISALFHRNESWDATINRSLFSFFTSFQPLAKKNKIKACLYKYSIHMSFPNRIETKTHTSFSKSGSQLISFKALALSSAWNEQLSSLHFIHNITFLTCSLQIN